MSLFLCRISSALCLLVFTTLTALGQAPPNLQIHDIQGVKSTTAATISPYVGQKVTTTGVVTAILSNGFFIQSLTPDGNPLTPEGIDVFTSSKPPTATVAIGNLVSVTGTVATFPAATASHTPATEISGSPVISLISTGNPLPAPIPLTASMLTPTGGLYQLTPYEGMRVSVASHDRHLRNQRLHHLRQRARRDCNLHRLLLRRHHRHRTPLP